MNLPECLMSLQRHQLHHHQLRWLQQYNPPLHQSLQESLRLSLGLYPSQVCQSLHPSQHRPSWSLSEFQRSYPNLSPVLRSLIWKMILSSL